MFRAFLLFVFFAQPLGAEGLALSDRVTVQDRLGAVEFTVRLDQVVPYRVFLLDTPLRLVMDVAVSQGQQGAVSLDHPKLRVLRQTAQRPGWSRLTLDLSTPMVPTSVQMDDAGQGAILQITLEPATSEQFAARAGAPPDPGWEVVTNFDAQTARQLDGDDIFVVVIDPSYGGAEQGEIVGGVSGADLALLIATELASYISSQDGFAALLTRSDDTTVSPAERYQLAQQAGADLVITVRLGFDLDTRRSGAQVVSLDADAALPQGSVATKDAVNSVLSDLALAQTRPDGPRFADALIRSLQTASVRISDTPRLVAVSDLLAAQSFPSVELVPGYLSNAQDRASLARPAYRQNIAIAVMETVRLLAR